MSNQAWLVVALAAVGVGIGSYLGYLVARMRQLGDRLADIEQREP